MAAARSPRATASSAVSTQASTTKSASSPRFLSESGVASMKFSLLRRTVLVAAAALAVTAVSQAADISGAGATFPYPVYAKWADAYKKQTGVGLNYQSIGSGGGI